MSSLYNKNYIHHKDDYNVDEIFSGKVVYKPNPNNLENREKYIAMQHYIVKYIEENGKTPIINRMLNKYLEDFLKFPHLFVDSPLIRDGFVNRYLPKDTRHRIIGFRDMYYDTTQTNEIYIKLLNNYTLSESQKNRLYSYLIYQMRIGNHKMETVYRNCITKIINSNKPTRELNNTELKFLCTYVARYAGKENEVFPDVHIVKRPANNAGSESNNIIYINKYTSYAPTIADIVQTVCHETKHAIQEKVAVTSKSKTAFDMASHKLLVKYLTTKDYNVYKVNYRYSDIELDAEWTSYFKAPVFLADFGRADLANVIASREFRLLRKRNYYECMINKEGKRESSDQFIVENLNKILRKHPDEIKRYKVFEEFYKPNGSPKPFINLLLQKQEKPFADKSIFDSFINHGIAKDELSKLNVSKMNYDYRDRVFKSLSQIFASRSAVLKKYVFDNDYKKNNPSQMRITTLYQIKLLDNIISFIDENMDAVLSLRENYVLSNKSFIYSFIREFNNFNLKYTQNEVLKNDKLIQERTESLIAKCRSVVKKYDKQFILDRISNLSDEELDTVIITPNQKSMSFRDYLFNELLPSMNGGKISWEDPNSQIDTIIKHYKKIVKKKPGKVGRPRKN